MNKNVAILVVIFFVFLILGILLHISKLKDELKNEIKKNNKNIMDVNNKIENIIDNPPNPIRGDGVKYIWNENSKYYKLDGLTIVPRVKGNGPEDVRIQNGNVMIGAIRLFDDNGMLNYDPTPYEYLINYGVKKMIWEHMYNDAIVQTIIPGVYLPNGQSTDLSNNQASNIIQIKYIANSGITKRTTSPSNLMSWTDWS